MTALQYRVDSTTLSVRVADVEIARYVADPDIPDVEARKPYMHPIRTLDGAVVSAYRPWDHPWHKGLQMTASVLSGQNFWGGKTYVDGEYLWLDNVGRMRHESFEDIAAEDDHLHIDERLSWETAAGAKLIAERRSMMFHGIDTAVGCWQLDANMSLENVHDGALSFGSPTTQGRPNAGYTGLFWRGPRSWRGGEVLAPGGQTEMMGERAPWLAISGRHDEIDGGATVLFVAGTTSGAAPLTWFVRSDPFAAINPSPAFHDVVVVEPGEALELRHRVVVFDRPWTLEELTPVADSIAADFSEVGVES